MPDDLIDFVHVLYDGEFISWEHCAAFGIGIYFIIGHIIEFFFRKIVKTQEYSQIRNEIMALFFGDIKEKIDQEAMI